MNVAALNITASADVSTVSPGSDVQYTVTATNTGQAPYSDASITLHLADTFEDATYNGDLAATSGTVTMDSATQTATWTGDLAARRHRHHHLLGHASSRPTPTPATTSSP